MWWWVEHTDGDGQALVKVGVGTSLLKEECGQLDICRFNRQQLSQRLGDLGALSTGPGSD